MRNTARSYHTFAKRPPLHIIIPVIVNRRGLFIVILFLFANILPAQEGGDIRLLHRFSWTEATYAFSYEVLIEKEQDGVFSKVLQEFTYAAYFYASLLLGDYRMQVTPHDFRNLPVEGSPWRYFRVASRVNEEEPGLVVEDMMQSTEDLRASGSPRFNTLGVSIAAFGSNHFIPVGGVVRGRFSPFNNLFVEGAVELSFWGAWNEMEARSGAMHTYRETFATHPFVNVGVFFPLTDRSGWYASAGAGVRFVWYQFELYDESWGYNGRKAIFAVNLTAGFNLWNWFDVSYTLWTDFTNFKSGISVGYVYRFMRRH